MLAPSATTYRQIADDLAERYADSVTLEQAMAAVDTARAELERVSRHPEFLCVLVTRRATELLHALADHDGIRMRPVPTFLFVCRHNTARSHVAAAFAERLGGAHVHARAAGTRDEGSLDPVVVRAMAERGVELHHYPPGPAQDVVHAADVVVEMGGHVDDLWGRSVRSWPVPDPRGRPIEAVHRICAEIESRVGALLTEFGVAVRTT